MKKATRTLIVLNCALAALVWTGCAKHQPKTEPVVEARAGEPAPAPEPVREPAPTAGYGPSYTTFEESGQRWVRGAMAFPTGRRESSGLLLEKTVPAEVLVGQSYNYAYKVSNLTDHPIQLVTVMDRVTANFTAADSNPKASDTRDGVVTWQLGTLGPKESKVIQVMGSSQQEGTVTTCGWATYSPLLCEDIRVVKANLQLVKTAPAEVIICDPIPMTLTVKNTGSSGLTAVQVVDTLPQGLVSDGKSSLSFDAGNLAPGQSREFKFNATAAKTGKFVNMAKATSAQGVTAEANSTTVVREPILQIACKAPEQQFIGRPFEVCFTVANKGDAGSAGTMVELPVPAGLTFRSATAGGRAAGNNVAWDLGALAANASVDVCATFVSEGPGTPRFAATAKGACAKPVSTTCQTVIVGVTALLLEKADNPDPISIGETTTYTVRVTNQGTADDTNIRMVVEFPGEIMPVAASNGGTIEGRRVTFPPYPRLAPKANFTYTIQARGEKICDCRVRFIRTSDGIPAPTSAEESTRVY